MANRKHNLRVKGWWKYLSETGQVRRTFIWYTPDDIQEIDCVDSLKNILDMYDNPHPTHQNDLELFYAWAMTQYINDRVRRLNKD